MVRYGVLGFIGYCLAVFTPLLIACKQINSKNPSVARCSLFTIIFIICQIVSGLSNEFLNLKAMVAFYAFMISVFIGTIISLTRKPESSTPQT
jgi:heme A synthase